MGNYEQLKQSVSDVIKTNGNQEITGSILQNVLLTIISSVGANATFAGIATPTTNPGTPDGPVFYLASEGGTYSNFNAIELQAGLSVLMWNGSWSSQQIFSIDDVPTAGSDNLVKSGGVTKIYGKYIENPEFVRVYTDAEDKILWGIKKDGGIYYGAGIPQQVIDYIEQKIAELSLDEYEDIVAFLNDLEKGDKTLQDLLDEKVDKVEGKSLIDEEYASTKSTIDNPEFLDVTTDSEDKVLEGIQKDGTKVIGGDLRVLGNMEVSGVSYKVIENPEYLAAWVDTENKVIFGLKSDGKTYVGDSDFLDDIKDIKSYLANFDNIDLDALSSTTATESPECISVVTDSEDKILAGRTLDGAAFENVGFSTPKVSTESVDIDGHIVENIEDPEGRTEITTDYNGNILKYRDKEGYVNECVGIKVSKKERERFASILKEQNFRGYVDYSDEKFVEIPIPRSISKVNFITPDENLPTWKGENLNGIIEFWDNDGNYFKKDISKFNTQGDTSQAMPWKNYGFDISDGSNIKFGNWIPCDSFHLKKYYLDCFRGQCIVAYRIAEQMYQTRTLDDRKPYQYLYKNNAIDNGNGIFEHDFYTGALCHPDGFPVKVYLNGKYKGIWVWALKKARGNYAMKKNNQKHILLDGRLGVAQLWGGSVDWTAFEIRNPKVKKDIEGNDYDGDNPKEPSSDYEEAKGYIERLSRAISDINSQQDTESKKSKFKEYFKLNEIIDYFLFGNVFGDGDGFEKNWIWGTWDGNLWSPTYYDKDQIFGIVAWGENPYADPNTSQLLGTNENIPSGLCWALFKEDIKAEYKRLRDSGVFSVNNIIYELEKWIKSIGYNNLKDEIENICVDSNGVSQTPTYRPKNDKQGNPIVYSMFPHNGGFFNSVGRIRNWLESHFTYLDSTEVFDYK